MSDDGGDKAETTEPGLPPINAMPTKKFFVDILTLDIPLDRAILDLVDNSVDGAKRLRPKQDATYEKLSVEVSAAGDHFEISDNCGGMSLEVARDYAFRFGRPRGAMQTPYSVGQFGVGMKRALFKMGRFFRVQSCTATGRFELEVDVDTWVADDDDWQFKFKSVVEASQPETEWGTKIRVERLRPDVREQFLADDFKQTFLEEIRKAQQHYIARKLSITLNGTPVPGMVWAIKRGQGIDPAFHQENVDVEYTADDGTKSKEKVQVRLYAGVSDSNRHEAGWYVFCNGRAIIEADQSPRTGWEATGDEAATTPKFHGQFARFRGYAFFDSPNAALLPWNTTKTDVDAESVVYRKAIGKMVDMMRPIIDFLNDLDAENDAPEDQRPLKAAIESAKLTSIEKVSKPSEFKRPAALLFSAPTTVRIAFRKPSDQVEELGNALDASKPTQIGEKAFEYAYAQLVQSE